MQSMSITTNVVSSNPAQARCTTLCMNTKFIARKEINESGDDESWNSTVLKCIYMAKSGRFPHLHKSPFSKNVVDALVNFNGKVSKICYFRNNRIPGQFAMCENLPWHRFQFNSQIWINFDIKQWFISDIRKMNILFFQYLCKQ